MESSVMKTTRLFNFSAGPGTLPLSVLQAAQQHLVSLPGVGISIMELSHRSSAFEEILGTAEANLRDLIKLPEHYRILFLHGGATLQFSMIPISFLRGTGSVAEYIVSGTWGQKALNEARREGDARVSWTDVLSEGAPANARAHSRIGTCRRRRHELAVRTLVLRTQLKARLRYGL